MDPNPDWTMPPTLARLASAMKSEKARSVRRGEDIIDHLVDVYRHGKRIARIATGDPEVILNLLYNAPGAMHADYIAVAADAWQSNDRSNPITGQDWGTGDMQRIVQNDLGLHRGLIGEQLLLHGFERDGDLMGHSVSIPYVHDRPKRRIVWSDPWPFESAGGRFPHVAADGFARPTLYDEMVAMVGPPPEGYDPERLLRKAAVTYVLALASRPHVRVIESPKGPPLGDGPPSSWP